jgi:tRNA (guanine37-N1)-methyltransferase
MSARADTNSFRHRLKSILPEAAHPDIVGAYEVIGDIVLVTLPDTLLPYRAQIGAALLAANARLRVAARRRQAIGGEFRLGGVEIIAGEPPLSTVHRENSLRFAVDVEKVYFSARLAGERLRLARLCEEGERILVAGSGVAPLPLALAALGKAAAITGIEKNPHAHALALENCRQNRRHSHKVTLRNVDCLALSSQAIGLFDRLVIAMPEIAFAALPHLIGFVKPGGFLHLYVFQNETQPEPAKELALALAAAERNIAVLAAIRCGHCGRGRFRYCLDARLD